MGNHDEKQIAKKERKKNGERNFGDSALALSSFLSVDDIANSTPHTKQRLPILPHLLRVHITSHN